ncbi:DUF4190 domain-containing protein [Catenuloplanes sp. NPDC051500]|uniref:DUF4190 domain-containing protein n=1 Tax=Catenuloplanes sp. NPDC051500 TaxID=3363959 RepID=UPI0037B73337
MTYPPQQPEGWSDPAYPAHPPVAHPVSGLPGQPPVSGPAMPGYLLIPDPANPYPQPGGYPQQPGAYPYPQPTAYPTDKDGGYPYAAGYPAQPGYGYGWQPQRKTSGMAIASLVISIIGAFSLACYGAGLVPGAIGAILGHVARRQIRTSGEDGDGMALAGIITGWIVAGLGLLIIGFVVFFVIAVYATAPDTNPGTGGPYY